MFRKTSYDSWFDRLSFGYVVRKPDESESIENKIEDMSLQSINDDKEISVRLQLKNKQ